MSWHGVLINPHEKGGPLVEYHQWRSHVSAHAWLRAASAIALGHGPRDVFLIPSHWGGGKIIQQNGTTLAVWREREKRHDGS